MRTCSDVAMSTAQMFLLSLLTSAPVAMAATSDSLYDRYFSNVLDGAPCFARTYSEKYLKANPAQRVRKIEIELAKTNADGTPNTADRFEIGFGVVLTSGPDWYGQTASCKTNDNDFDCYLEGDGGDFRLSPGANGGLRLETGETGLSFESSETTIELSGKDGVDRVFELLTSKQECQSASAYFDRDGD